MINRRRSSGFNPFGKFLFLAMVIVGAIFLIAVGCVIHACSNSEKSAAKRGTRGAKPLKTQSGRSRVSPAAHATAYQDLALKPFDIICQQRGGTASALNMGILTPMAAGTPWNPAKFQHVGIIVPTDQGSSLGMLHATMRADFQENRKGVEIRRGRSGHGDEQVPFLRSKPPEER